MAQSLNKHQKKSQHSMLMAVLKTVCLKGDEKSTSRAAKSLVKVVSSGRTHVSVAVLRVPPHVPRDVPASRWAVRTEDHREETREKDSWP